MRFLTIAAILAVAVLAAAPDAGTGGVHNALAGDPSLQGDVNCSAAVDSIDSLQILRNAAGLPITADCLDAAADVNCDAERDSIDSLRILRFVAGLPNAPVEGCTAIGEPLAVPTFLLNEVMFLPEGNDTPFVELKNTGDEAASPAGLTLLNEADDALVITDGAPDVEPDGVALVQLKSGFPDPESGFVELRAGAAELDHVAWGEGQPDGVRLSRGGLSEDPVPGSTIGRIPSSETRSRSDWVPFSPAQATPGEPNTLPGVEVLMPLHGAILDSATVPLTWYPIAGAAEYRVQVASEDTFATPAIDEVTKSAEFAAAPLADGDYFWRVQAIHEDAIATDFSATHAFTIDSDGGLFAAGPPEVVLDVPMFEQRKDTKLLLLESPVASGPHAWDAAHPEYHPNDPADNTNCALASIAMINAFLGGDLSQDRIGMHVMTAFDQPVLLAQPEFAIYFDRGTTEGETTRALQFAIGTGIFYPRSGIPSDNWNLVKDAIDSGFPLIGAAASPTTGAMHHAVVITGYATDGVIRGVAINDPATGQYAINFDTVNFKGFWGPDPKVVVNVRSDEPSIHQDSDNDGMVDFDESVRFKTNPTKADTDDDLVPDKEEVRETVFHPTYGHAYREGLRVRYDWDDDDLHKERDCDNDNDGHVDGVDTDDYSTPPVRGSPASCSLGGIWTGEAHTVEVFGSGDQAQTRTIDATGIVFAPRADCPTGPVECFETIGGVVRYTVSGYAAPGCTAEGELTVEVPRGNAILTVYTNTNTYSVPSAYIEANIAAVMTCGTKSANVQFEATPWLTVAEYPWPDRSVIEGEYNVEPNESGSFHSEWRLVRAE